jgi:hypothetical protein
MRLQSAVEYMTTYAVMFIILAFGILLVYALSSSARTYVPPICVGVSGFSCNFDTFFSNSISKTSNAILILSNSQTVPVNVFAITVRISNQSSTGSCSPTFIYPGKNMTCTVTFSGTKPSGSEVTGVYVVNALYCNSGISQLNPQNCKYTPVTYVGQFTTYTYT